MASGNEASVFTPTASQSKLFDSAASSCRGTIGTKTVAAAGSGTMSWTLTNSNRTAQAVVAVRPSTSTGTCQAEGGDGCSELCQVDPGWTCPFPDTSCVAQTCGDGYLTGSELCEKGLLSDTTPSAACANNCTVADGSPASGELDTRFMRVVRQACDNACNLELGDQATAATTIVDGCTRTARSTQRQRPWH